MSAADSRYPSAHWVETSEGSQLRMSPEDWDRRLRDELEATVERLRTELAWAAGKARYIARNLERSSDHRAAKVLPVAREIADRFSSIGRI